MEDRVCVAWLGSIDPNTGYGSSNNNLKRALLQAGIGISQPENVDISIAYTSPTTGLFDRLAGNRYRVLFTMFEADRWPAHLVETCNCAHQVWVPSEFCRETLIASGCDRPVHVVPLGVDPEQYYPAKKSRRNKTFTFGYAGAAHYRKGFDLLIKAFREEFGPDDNVNLVIRSSVPDTEIPHDSRIAVIGEALDVENMRRFYQELDCLVLPTRGEGFGLTAIEAMACGTCVTTTRYGGQADFMGEHCLPIEVSGMEPCEEYHDCKGRFFTPSIASMREQMRWAYENRKACWDIGTAAAEVVKSHWTYAHAAARIKELLDGADLNEKLDVAEVGAVIWRGNPRVVSNSLGGFVRDVPRILTPEQMEQINPNDQRYERVTVLRRV